MRKKPSEQTIKKLFAHSGNICAFPNCDEEIIDKDGNVIGEICHIEAAERNGPRYNPNQTDDERKAVDNLVLLCGKHNKIIDNDANQYTVDYLKQIKKVHESRNNRNEIEITNTLLRKINDKLDDQQQKQKSLSIIPHYDIKKLIGRTDMLDKLHKMLTENKSAILMNGIGGIGKTTVAIAYCNTVKYQKEYQNIVWVTLTQSLKESIINTFIDKDIDFKYNEKEDTDKNFNHLLNTLRNITGNNLLAIDNANIDKEIIENKQALEDTNWKILLTTRCLLDYEYTIKVDKLSEEDAVKVFLQYCKVEDMETLKKLLFHIDYHTLLTELLAKTLKRSPLLDINKLYEIIKSQDISAPRIKKEIPIGAHAEYRQAAKKEEELYTYILGIFELKDMSEKENEYLRYFSILPSVEIYIEDLLYFFVITEEKEIPFENTLNSLVQKGWVQENNKTYKMHHLIQAVIREKLKPDAENCKDIIISFCWLLKWEPKEHPISRKEIVPFAESIWLSVYNFKNEQNILTNDLSNLVNNLAIIFNALGNYDKALNYQEKSISIREKVLNQNHPDLATSYNDIALTYRLLGNYEKALEYYKKSISIGEKVLAPDHPDLATLYNNIALTYRDLGKYEKALEYVKISIVIKEKVLESNHPDLATSYNNIAITYLDLGNYEKALEYQEKSVTIREKVLDKNNPNLATSYNNIAQTYQYLGVYQKSLEYNFKSLDIYKKVLDKNHPDIARSYNNIAITYKYLGNYEKSLEYHEKSIAIREKVLDANHPDLASSYNNIALTYRNLGNYDKALEYQEKSIAIYEKVLEPTHPVLATSYGNIALTYQDLGNYDKALEYQKKDLAIIEKVLDENHPDLATSYGNIGETYRLLGNYDKALEYQKKSLAIYEKVLEPDHPFLASSYNNIASTYRFLGNYEKALEYHFKSILIREIVLESNHPDLATSYSNIAATYIYLGNYEKALEYQKKSISIREKILDINHPDLANSYYNIAVTYYCKKNYKNAKFYIDKAVAILIKALSKDHPHLKSSLEMQKNINIDMNRRKKKK